MQPARFRQGDFLLVEINNTKVHESSREVRGRSAGSFPGQRLAIEPNNRASFCFCYLFFRSSNDHVDISKMSDAAPYHWNDNRRDRGSGSEDRCETSLINEVFLSQSKTERE